MTWKNVVIGVVITDLVAELVTHKIALNRANARLRTAAELTRYLATMIGESNVPIDEFDSIAIDAIING